MDKIKFQPLKGVELSKLKVELLANAEEGAALHMDANTKFVAADELEDEAVVSAIRSIPCHY